MNEKGMSGVLLTHRVKPEHLQDFVETYRRFAQTSRDVEPGCVRYDVMQDTEDPTIIYAHAVFRDEDGRQAHYGSPHAERWRDTSRPWRVMEDTDDPSRRRRFLSYVNPEPTPDAWK